jgi:hypothetical protein
MRRLERAAAKLEEEMWPAPEPRKRYDMQNQTEVIDWEELFPDERPETNSCETQTELDDDEDEDSSSKPKRTLDGTLWLTRARSPTVIRPPPMQDSQCQAGDGLFLTVLDEDDIDC